MLVKPEDLAWQEKGYVEWQGFLWRGRQKWEAPATLTDDEKYFSILLRTESGGALDATQSYDSMGLTTGGIQWGEIGTFMVTRMLGEVGLTDPKLLEPLQPALRLTGATLGRNAKGSWRWKRRGQWVETKEQQSALLRGTSTGKRGTWKDADKAINAAWVAGVASVFQDPRALAVQLGFTFARIRGFAGEKSKAVLWAPGLPKEDKGLVGALRAIFLSYAANLPAMAETMLLRAVNTSKAKPWSEAWVGDCMESLIYGPDIAIYEHRYKLIEDLVERYYGVQLPQVDAPTGPLRTTRSVQEALLRLGYDFGSVDGIEGPKTRAAITSFQKSCGLKTTGAVDMQTRDALLGAIEAMDQGQGA